MDIPGVRPRMASPSFDFDLENAPFKAHSSEDRQKNQSVVEYLKQASRLWLALAACIIFIFFCVSSSYMPSSPRPPATHYHPGVTPVARSSSGLGGQDAGSHHPHPDHLHSKHVAGHKHHHPHAAAAAAAAQYKEQLQKHALHEVPQQEDLEALHAEEEEEEETVPADEEEEEEEEHADSDSHEDEGNEHFAEAHPEYSLSHDGLFDESKQHPDEPEYVDIWDGVTQEDLHLSSGVPGLKTPLYRLPFLDGQHNHSHVLGVYAKQVFMPRYLKVSGGKRLPLISGTYKMLMVPDGRPKPHLNHGRLIWRQESAPASPVYLYYDHMHHTWLFGTALDLRAPKPLAFLAHGAMLPIHRQHDKSFRKYGVPKSVHWIVRSEGGSKPDSSIKVEADPARSSGGDHLQPLLLQKVYHSPEDGTLEHDGEFDEDNFALFEEENEEEMEEEEEDEQEVPLDANGEPAHLPLGARTFQQFLTHLKTSVYHTFDTLHPKYNHDKILEDPIAFVEGNPHPDLVGPETLDGYGHEPTPHPLRTPASGNDEH